MRKKVSSPSSLQHETLADFIFFLREAHGARENFFTVHRNGELISLSCGELIDRAHALAAVFDVGGLVKGDRVAIIAENAPEWHIVDFACQLLGVISVPIFPNLPSAQISNILSDSGAQWVFYSGEDKRKMLLEMAAWQKEPPKRVTMLPSPSADSEAFVLQDLLDQGEPLRQTLTFEDLRGRVQPDDLSSLLYTSGTTGLPKGVMLTHRNLTSNLLAACEVYPGEGGEDEQCVCFLPLSHIFARTTTHLFLNLGIPLHYVARVEDLPQALQEVRPTVLASVPLVFEKALSRIEEVANEGSKVRNKLFEWAVGTGKRHLEARLTRGKVGKALASKRKVADWLVFRKIQERFGGRLKLVVGGGAPLTLEVEAFFHAAGIGLYQGYGLTETSPLLTINYPGKHRLGSVGVPGPGVEIELASDDEILARSPGIMRGYWKKTEATEEVIDAQGWFHTGDLGYIDDDGFLFITGRKKDLLVMADGTNVAPAPIEQLLSSTLVISQSVVVGDGSDSLVALLVPDFDQLQTPGEPERRVVDPKAIAEVKDVVDAVNKMVADHEKIRAFRLLPRPFSIESGELTPTLKVRRQVVIERYQQVIRELYGVPVRA